VIEIEHASRISRQLPVNSAKKKNNLGPYGEAINQE